MSILLKILNCVFLKFCVFVYLILVLLSSKSCVHLMHGSREIRKMDVGNGGQFLKKYEHDLLEILCVCFSHYSASILQISWPSNARFARYDQINLCSISTFLLSSLETIIPNIFTKCVNGNRNIHFHHASSIITISMASDFN